jgi:predicted DNA-binding transcriptional regulator YafY
MIAFIVGLVIGLLIGLFFSFRIIYAQEREKAAGKFLNRKSSKIVLNEYVQKLKKGQKLEIKYVDMSARESERKIRIIDIIPKPSGTDYELYCYCYLKKEERTFLVSRILEAVDIESGEVIIKNDIMVS